MQPNELRAALEGGGVAVVRGIGSLSRFAELTASLGQTVHETRVALDVRKETYLTRPEAVPLHTDHPDVATIGWYCEEQDGDDGANLFVDGRGLLDEHLQHDLEDQSLPVPCLRRLGGRTTDVAVVRDGKLFFAPWLVKRWSNPLKDFARRLHEVRRLRVRLAPGDAVFIDNGRVLHGREAIGRTSKRVLFRRWIG